MPSASILLAVLALFWCPAETTAAAALRVAVAGDACPPSVCAALLPALTAAGMKPTSIDDAALAKLSKASFDVLLLPNAPTLPAAAAPAYFAFAKAGGHLVLLGGRPPRLNITANFASLNVLDTYEPYHMRGAVSVEPLPAAAAIGGTQPPMIAGAVSGLSAIAFAREGQSAFVPLLHAVDKHQRSVGWALSAVVNTGGAYNGSVWLLSGVEEPAFLASPSFVATLAAAIKAGATTPSLVSSAAASFQAAGLAKQEAAVAAMAASTSPSPPGFVKTGSAAHNVGSSSRSSKHLLYADDGSRYFMLGGDYFRGMFNSSLNAVRKRLSGAV